MAHCHCSICRKIHGTAFATYVQTDGVEWLTGEENIARYRSSENFERCFCDRCGSVLPEQVDGEDFMFVAAGGLDGELGIRPEKHIFATSRASWYDIPGALPQFEGYSEHATDGIHTDCRTGRVNGATAGSCLCDAVAYQFTGEAKLMMYCHCTRCRKVKGAAHAMNVFVPPDNFTWLRGEDNVVNYSHAEAERFGNSFCATCGSSVPRKSPNSPMVNIPAGSLDDAPGIGSRGHIYVGSKSDWFEISDQLEQFDEMP
jgi:hypothetical protein